MMHIISTFGSENIINIKCGTVLINQLITIK